MTSDPRAVPPAQRTLPAMLQRQAALFGGRPLLRIAGRQWTHADAADAAGTRAGALGQHRVGRGGRLTAPPFSLASPDHESPSPPPRIGLFGFETKSPA